MKVLQKGGGGVFSLFQRMWPVATHFSFKNEKHEEPLNGFFAFVHKNGENSSPSPLSFPTVQQLGCLKKGFNRLNFGLTQKNGNNVKGMISSERNYFHSEKTRKKKGNLVLYVKKL